ncbi:MAG: hypothetical protein N2748_03585, partial [candidate division WOR-3 bacterium]|nr:hypothetical protein [candidate division WOR-3 bacterium]
MKYTITVNQLGILYSGLIAETDLVDWAIVDYLKDFVYYRDRKRIIYQGEEYIWLNYKHLISSLPLVHLPDKRTLWRRISKLRRLGLIKTLKAQDNTLYYTFTERLIDICFTKKSDIERLKANRPVSNKATGPVSIMDTGAVSNMDTGGVSNMDTAQLVTKYQLVTNNQLVTKNNINDINDISFSFLSSKKLSFLSSKKQREEDHKATENTEKIRLTTEGTKMRKSVSSKQDKQVKSNKDTKKIKLAPKNTKGLTEHNTSGYQPVKSVNGFTSLSDGIWKVL